MNELQFFLLHHRRLHFEPGGLQHRIQDITDEQMRMCPNNLNSIAWILWHIARCEDVGINRFVCETPQVFYEDNWLKKLNITRIDIGTGMTSAEVTELSSKINIDALRNYIAQVVERTQSGISNIKSDELDKIPDPSYLNKVLFDEGAIIKNNKRVAENYSGKTKGWFLGHLGLTHARGHLGQIIFLRKLLGLTSGGL